MMRPTWFVGLFVVAVFGWVSPAVAQQDNSLPAIKHLIDTHIHLYDTTRDVYDRNRADGVPWPPHDDEILHKPHLPAEFRSVAKPAGVTGVIVVEASPRVDDNAWVLDLVKGDDFYVGLVGNIDPFDASFAKYLEHFQADSRFVGIRVHLMNRGAGVAKNVQLLENLKRLADQGLTLDVLMNAEGPETIDEVNQIAIQIPELRIVVNHVLGYNIDGNRPPQRWIASVKQLAKNPNVWVKISGLYQRSTTQPAPPTITYYDEVLDVLWDAFGRERLIYGSNWPVTKKSGSYESFVRLVGTYFSPKGQPALERLFWQNATDAYNLKW